MLQDGHLRDPHSTPRVQQNPSLQRVSIFPRFISRMFTVAAVRWEASAALRKVLVPTGIRLDGAPGGWAEMYRVYKECKVRLLPVFFTAYPS
jgi:hypothetical protein